MSYESRTVADQNLATAALTQFATDFAHLPAADFSISRIYSDRLTVVLHDDLADFETWREALGIAAAAVEFKTLRDFSVVEADCPWGFATVELVGYGSLPLDDSERGAR